MSERYSDTVFDIIYELDRWLALQVLTKKLTDKQRGELARALRAYLGPIPDWAKESESVENKSA